MLIVTWDAYRVNRFERWPECKETLTRCIGCLQAIQGPNGHLVVFRLFFQALADWKGIFWLHKELVNIVRVPLVEKSLLLERWIKSQQQICLRVKNFFRELWVRIEKHLAWGVVRMPSYNSVKPHDRIWFEYKLFASLCILSWVVESFLLIKSNFSLLCEIFGM